MLKALGIYNTKFYEYVYSNLYVDGKLDKEKINQEIIKIERNHKENCEQYSYKDIPPEIGKTYYNLKSILIFLDLSVNITKFWGGFIEIDTKYVYSLSSGKWRFRGQNKWSKRWIGISDFVKDIVNKENK